MYINPEDCAPGTREGRMVAAVLDRSSGPRAVNQDAPRDCRGRPAQAVGSRQDPSVVQHLDWD
jgi:hypothetical protein